MATSKLNTPPETAKVLDTRRQPGRIALFAGAVGAMLRAENDLSALLPSVVEGAMALTRASGAAIETRGCDLLPSLLALGAYTSSGLSLSARYAAAVEECLAPSTPRRARRRAQRPADAESGSIVCVPVHCCDCGRAALTILSEATSAFGPDALEDLKRFSEIAGTIICRSLAFAAQEGLLGEQTAALANHCESEVQFRAALGAAHEAIVIRDRSGSVTAANESARRVLGFSAEELFTCRPVAREWTLVHEDRSQFALPDLPDMVAMSTCAAVSEQVVGIERWDGTVTWLSVSACPLISGGAAEPYGAIMTFTDITERKAAFEANARLAAIVDSSQDGILGATLDGTIVSWNRGAERLFGYGADEMLGRASSVLSPANDPVSFKATIKRLMQGERIDVDECVRFRKDGVPVTVAMTYSLIRNARAEAVGIAAIARDVSDRVRYEEQIRSQMRQINEINAELQNQKTQLEQANVKLEQLATLDGLTGLKNRRVFQESLVQEIDRAARYNTPLSIFMLDVDSFKEYNDSFGHPAGDDVLRKIARVLIANCRRADLLARYGGEEFVVILPQTPAEGARVIAERCRNKIQRAVWPLRPVTASFGVSTLNAVLDSPTAIVAAADRALYHAKSRGKNCVSHVFDMPSATSALSVSVA